eukprot:408465_1
MKDLNIFNDNNKKINKMNSDLKIMKKLVVLTKKKRNIYFKTHPSELVLWKRFLLFKEITPKLLSYILKGIKYVFPYANLNLKIFSDDLDYIYKLILSSNIKIAFVGLEFTYSVESTYEISISGTNITDKTPTQIVKYGKNRQSEIETKTINKVSDRFYKILYKIINKSEFINYTNSNNAYIINIIKLNTVLPYD